MKQFIKNDSWFLRNLNIILKTAVFLTIFTAVASSGLTGAEASTAVTPVPTSRVTVTIDYLEETARVTAGPANSTKFYVSKDKMKTWESIEPNSPMDISAILSTKEVTLCFKGNKDTLPAEVVLQKEDSSLKAVYSVFNGAGRILLTGTNFPIEYRKNTSSQWKPVGSTTFLTALYETYGTTLYFRTTADVSRRAGKIVSVKVTKRPSAPSVKLDGSKLYITGLKAGETQYRVGDSTVWIDFAPADAKLKTKDLKDFLGTESNSAIKAGVIEFRTKYDDGKKKLASSVRIIEVPAQPIAPANVTIAGTTITSQDTDKKKYYEYAVVTGTAALNAATAKWSSFTSAKPVIVKGANVGDRIYVRAKSYTDKETKLVIPASLPRELPVMSITTPTK